MRNSFRFLFLSFFTVLMSCQNQTQEESAGKSLVIAHRGASYYAPENTVAAAKLAWQQNADAVEVDVHLSADHQIVVIHDYDTERTAGKKFVISETPMDSLRALEVGSFKAEEYKGEPIPILDEIVETVPEGKTLFVEIKSDEKIVPVLKQAFGEHPKINQFVFIAFDYEVIKEAKKAFPDNQAYWLSSQLEEDLQTVLQRVKEDGLDGVNLNHKIITPAVTDLAEELGLSVYAWTVNDQEKAVDLQRMGVKGITTDMPDQILTALAKGNENQQAASVN